MRRALKILAALVLLIGTAAVAVVALLPSEKIAALVGDQVRAATGRELTLSGGLRPSIWPVLGVETGAFALGNATWGEAPALLSAEGARIGVELMPLLSGEIRVKEIRLVKPVVALEVSETGAQNWAFGSGGGEGQGDGGALPRAFSLAEAALEDGTVSYSDRRSGLRERLENVDLRAALPALDGELTATLAAVRNGAPLSLDLALRSPAALLAGETVTVDLDLATDEAKLAYEGTVTPPGAGGLPRLEGAFSAEAADPAALAALAGADPAPLAGIADLVARGRVSLGEVLALDATLGLARDGERLEATAKADAAAGWLESRAFDLDLSGRTGSGAAFGWKGRVAPGAGAAPVTAKGNWSLSAADPSKLAALAGADPAPLKGLSGLDLSGALDLSAKGLAASAKGGLARDGQRASIDLSARGGADWAKARAFRLDLKAALEGLATLSFAGDAAAPEGGAPTVSGALDLDAPDLRALAAFAGVALPEAKPNAFRRLRVTGDVTTPAANQIRLAASRIALDEIEMSGPVRVAYGGKPSVSAVLEAGDLNLRRYLGSGDEAPPAAEGWSREKIDLSGLDAFDLDATLRAKSVALPNGIALGRSDVTAKVAGGRLDLTVKELGFYGGGVEGAVTLGGDKAAALSAKVTASAVRLLPMLRALAGYQSLEGLGAVSFDVRGSGESLDAIMRSLDGSGDLRLSDGAIVGWNLAALARNLTGGDGGEKKTDFSEVAATFAIRNGAMSTSDFRLLGPLIRVTGEGVMDLGAQTMNFRLSPKAVATLKGQGGKADKAGLAFPLIISGPWSDLSIRPDLTAALTDILSDPGAALDAAKGVIGGGAGAVLEGATGAGGALGAAAGAAKALGKGDAAGAATEALRGALGQPEAETGPTPEELRKMTPEERRAARKAERQRKRQEEQQRRNDPAGALIEGVIGGVLKKN